MKAAFGWQSSVDILSSNLCAPNWFICALLSFKRQKGGNSEISMREKRKLEERRARGIFFFPYLALGNCHQDSFSHFILNVTFNLSVQASNLAAWCIITNFSSHSLPPPPSRKLLKLPRWVPSFSSDSPIKLKIAAPWG